MAFPEPLRQLYAWIETHGHCITLEGRVIGSVGKSLTDYCLTFQATGKDSLDRWFGIDPEDPRLDRLCVFAHTGNAMVAFWLNAQQEQRIVVLGSEGGAFVLVQEPLDLLRLQAIGYAELSGMIPLDLPPDPTWVVPNPAFRAWVEDTFQTTIPETASALMPHVPNPVAALFEDEPEDEFARWVEEITHAGEATQNAMAAYVSEILSGGDVFSWMKQHLDLDALLGKKEGTNPS